MNEVYQMLSILFLDLQKGN